jgi:propanediol dehydratase small subunit
MRRSARIATALLLAATAAAAASHAAAPAANAPAPAAARAVGPTGIVLPAADPMAAEMQREIERSQREYAALFQRLSLARAESEALAIEEDMRQERVGLQIGLLRIQAAYARRAGRNAFADQLERAVTALIAADPPKPSGPDGQRRL